MLAGKGNIEPGQCLFTAGNFSQQQFRVIVDLAEVAEYQLP